MNHAGIKLLRGNKREREGDGRKIVYESWFGREFGREVPRRNKSWFGREVLSC